MGWLISIARNRAIDVMRSKNPAEPVADADALLERFAEPIDREIGDLVTDAIPREPWFSYVRYNRSYEALEVETMLKENPSLARLDAVHAIPILRRIGKAYAEEVLEKHPEHFMDPAD